MPGDGAVTVGAHGVGGMEWSADIALGIDFWVSALPTGGGGHPAAPIYKQ